MHLDTAPSPCPLCLVTQLCPCRCAGVSWVLWLLPSLPSVQPRWSCTPLAIGGSGRACIPPSGKPYFPGGTASKKCILTMYFGQGKRSPHPSRLQRPGLVSISEHSSVDHPPFCTSCGFSGKACPARAWLTHLEEDLQHLLQYNEGVAVLTHSDLPLRALTEAILSDRGWWRRQIAAASRAYFADLDRWHSAHLCQLSAPTAPPSPSEDAFQCPFCSSCFPLRKHLGTHVARKHGYFAPARLLAYHPTCVACLRFFHSISRLQRHLKGSRGCLLRTSLLVPPMGITEVHQVEATDRANVKKLRQGFWQLHGSVPPILQTYGPPQPSREELLSYLEDEAPLTLLGRPLRDPALEAWVQSEIPKKTSEPPRPGTCSFWAYRIGLAPARFT